MKFEIINPSDKAYIEGEFKTCCLATVYFGNGKYALQQVDGELHMPLFLFGGADEWFTKTFGATLQQIFDATPLSEISDALLSVKLSGKRSSLNDFAAYANKLGIQLKGQGVKRL